MRALVTGGAGFIGSALIRALVRDGAVVLSVDDYSSGDEARHVVGAQYVRCHTACMHREADVATFAPTHVFHFAEFSRIVPSFDDPDVVMESNLRGTFAVMRYALRNSAKLVYSGSSAIFGNGMRDQHLNPYAWTKSKNIELLRNMRAWYGLDYAVCYFYNVYGPGQIESGTYATVIGIFERQRREGRPLTVVSPGTQTRAFTHIDDVVRGVIVTADQGSGDGYLLGHEESFAILDVARLFGGPIEMVAPRRGEREHSEVRPSRARDELGWQPHLSLREYLKGAPCV